MDQPSNMPDIAVHQVNAGDGDGADMVFDYNGRKISVSVFPSSLREEGQEDVQGRLIDLLGRAVTSDTDDEYEKLVDEALSIIIDAGKAAFDHVAQTDAPLGTAQNLHSVLYPPTSTFCLQAVSGEATVVPIQPHDAFTVQESLDDSIHSDLDLDDNLPRYASDDIVISELFVCGGSAIVARVLVEGKEMLCKASGRGLRDTRLKNELTALQTIRAARVNHSGSVRVPHMLGYVRHAESGAIVGLLREWISGEVLRGIDVATVPRVTRQKWMSQIHQTIYHLHEMDLVWGDGKAANIIIDKEENAWLIDFGGGWTDGWVDEELADSVQGDDQAVMRISEFLELGLIR